MPETEVRLIARARTAGVRQVSGTAESKRIMNLLADLSVQPLHPFPNPRKRLQVPNMYGVYVIRGPAGKVWHGGRTVRGKNRLRQRLQNHLQGQSSFVRAALSGDGSKLRTTFVYQYLELPNERKRALLECMGAGWHSSRHIGRGLKR